MKTKQPKYHLEKTPEQQQNGNGLTILDAENKVHGVCGYLSNKKNPIMFLTRSISLSEMKELVELLEQFCKGAK